MPPQFKFDKQLAQDLGQLKGELVAKQESLRQERHECHECVCDEDGLCAHHADVNNHLEDAIKALHRAILSTLSHD